MINNVVKRDGTVEKFDPSKLTKWAEWASVVGVDWFAVASEAYSRCHDGTTTAELHDALVKVCIDLETEASMKMAGRLMVGDLYKRVFGGNDLPDLKTYVRKMIAEGFYADQGYTDDDLDHLNEFIDHSADFDLTSTQVMQDIQKYLISDITTRQPKETPQFALMRQAMGAHHIQPEDRKLNDVVLMYQDLKNSLVNTPTPNKNNLGTEKKGLASCCISMATDELNSIEAQNHAYWAMTAASAGQGGYLQTRSLGDKVRGGVIKHGGKLPYLRLQEAETKANMQGTRGGALTTYLNALDPEIFVLLAMRNPTTVVDKRVDGIDNCFMFNESFVKRAFYNKEWLLISYAVAPDLWDAFFEPDTARFDTLMDEYIKSGKGEVIKARALLKKHIIEDEVSGRQYEFNVTAANKHTSYKDRIHSSNLCLEAIFPTAPYKHLTELYETDPDVIDKMTGEVGICNLAAMPVGRFSDDMYGALAYRTLLMVDNVIEQGEFPLPQVTYTAKARRSVGIGITNLAYAMAKEGLTYDSPEGKAFCHRLAELHLFSLLKASVQLAKEKGKCKWFDRTRYADGWLPIDTYNKYVDKITDQPLLQDWEWLRGEIKKYGLRHSSLVNHMPVESSSVRNGDTNGLYPIRRGVVVKTSGNTKLIFMPPEYERLKDKYQLAWDIDHDDLVEVYAIFQKFADQGISADVYHKYEAGKDKKVSLKLKIHQFFYRQRVGLKSRYYSNTATGITETEQENACGSGGCTL